MLRANLVEQHFNIIDQIIETHDLTTLATRPPVTLMIQRMDCMTIGAKSFGYVRIASAVLPQTVNDNYYGLRCCFGNPLLGVQLNTAATLNSSNCVVLHLIIR